MQLLISDTNILIDIETAQITVAMFQLDYRFAVLDIIYEEELKSHHSHMPELGLQILELNPSTIDYTIRLAKQYPETSRNDLLALALAKQERCTLLTGDKALRKAAENEKVTVYGTIWLIKQMINQNTLKIKDAWQAHDKMKQANRRLPWGLFERMLKAI